MKHGWMFVVVGLVGFLGCSSEDDATSSHEFADEAGRSCVVSGSDVSCTGPGPQVACGTGATTCFGVIGLEMSPMQSCAMCCEADGIQSYDEADCVAVPCKSNADCGFDAATCKSGYCWCAVGKC